MYPLDLIDKTVQMLVKIYTKRNSALRTDARSDARSDARALTGLEPVMGTNDQQEPRMDVAAVKSWILYLYKLPKPRPAMEVDP